MNCQYRILEQVHIGAGVRSSKGPDTIPFDNKPMTDVELVSWDKSGFILRHPALPKDIWVDFRQLPLNAINIEMGIIKNPITFVEEIRNRGTMVLMRADLLDYYELLQDKKDREAKQRWKIRDLQVGETVVSSICKDGNRMVYMGTFHIALSKFNDSNSYYRKNKENQPQIFIDSVVARALFAYEQPGGSYNLQWYALDNKIVRELYRTDTPLNEQFSDSEKNLQIANTLAFRDYNIYQKERNLSPTPEKISGQLYKVLPGYRAGNLCHIQLDRESCAQNAVEHIKSLATQLEWINPSLVTVAKQDTIRQRRW